jgi:hypothetical protein
MESISRRHGSISLKAEAHEKQKIVAGKDRPARESCRYSNANGKANGLREDADPSPMHVDALIRTVRRGRLVTQSQIRENLSRPYKAGKACPIATGIFVRISSEAAEEDLRLGKKRVTPYWRVIRDDATLNEKLKKQRA